MANQNAFEAVPYLLHGRDWGKTKVLAKNAAGDLLVWCFAGSVWSGLHGTQSCPADLRLIYGERRGGRVCMTLTEGGRLSRARMNEYEAAIDAVFGAGATRLIDLKKTVTIDLDSLVNAPE